MSEHTLKNRQNGNLMRLQRLCRDVQIEQWGVKFQSTVQSPSGEKVDMHIVYKGKDPGAIVSIGVNHGDLRTPQFLSALFAGIVPALAGSILLLDLYDTLVENKEVWDIIAVDDAFKSELLAKLQVITNAVDRADRIVPES